MTETAIHERRSQNLALRLFDRWVRARQNRPPIHSTDNAKELKKIEQENFRTQLVEPRKRQLAEIKDAGEALAFSDQVALLVMMELPSLETSTLLHRLSRQVAADPGALYFSKENLADNCGCGCGCGCLAMADLSYQEQIVSHHQTKPYSIDPFNELKTPAKTRDALKATDVLNSYADLSGAVSDRVNGRYFQMGKDFGGP